MAGYIISGDNTQFARSQPEPLDGFSALRSSRAKIAKKAHDTRLPVVIEILTWMSYIFRSGKDLCLGSSGLSLQTSCLRADVKSSMIDNGGKGSREFPALLKSC
jgi:hypothetical protein